MNGRYSRHTSHKSYSGSRKQFSEPILPRSTRGLLSGVNAFPMNQWHPGLQLDKYGVVGNGDMKAQRTALTEVTKSAGDSDLLKKLYSRRSAMLKAMGACTVQLTTSGPLTLHLARAGTWENAGICLHPVYGFAYLSGSGIKGLVRSWAETVWAPEQPDQEAAWRTIEALFGYSPHSEGHKSGWRPGSVTPPDGSATGRLIFHDAWPDKWPCLEVDVNNNHHTKYYAGEEDPGDWEDPVPVYFLAVSGGTQFHFAVTDRRSAGDDALVLAATWLREALQSEGAGAKTAAGYGRFVTTSESDIKSMVSSGLFGETYTLELVSPAFLAGADQKRGDCTLRGATLRGLLRWWWRTMYAAKVDRNTLRKLEAAVWGDTERGSPVRLLVRFVQGYEPKQYTKSPQFLREHGIPPNRSRKTTLGLYYASYGMAEKGKHRWYRPAGCQWEVAIAARSGRFGSTTLSAETLIRQATTALWLLARYGGAGSRSRKGFGSFRSIEVPGISTKEDCVERAEQFLAECAIQPQYSLQRYAPSLETALITADTTTHWRDPWFACHKVGSILQRATKSLDKQDRGGLGLPRKGASNSRHASPVQWSLDRTKEGSIVIRMIAFPSPRLPSPKRRPSWDESEFILEEFKEEAERVIAKRRKDSPQGGQITRSPARKDRPTESHAAKRALPKPGDRVKAELLEEKTKKGGWRARHLESGIEGPLVDRTTKELVPGQEVELIVHSSSEERKQMNFRWEAIERKPRSSASKGKRATGRKRKRRRR